MESSLNSAESVKSSLSGLNLQEAGEKVSAKLSSALSIAKDQSKDFSETAQSNIRRHPLAYVTGAFATGFLVARLMKRFR